jgi:hypothetical protein
VIDRPDPAPDVEDARLAERLAADEVEQLPGGPVRTIVAVAG